MSWLKYLSRGPGPLVVCFPHSGGAAGMFRPLAAHLSVVGVQYPGRQDRFTEPVITDLHSLADQIAAVLPPEPSVYFGHSMGAILAYEVAQRAGSPIALIASARPAPSRVRLTTDYQLSDAGLISAVTRLGGTEAQVLADPDMRAFLLPMIRGDYQASETYRSRGDDPLDCPVVAVAGDCDPAASLDDVAAWASHTTGTFRLEVFSGDHFYLYDHWPAIATLIREACSLTQ